MTWYGMHYATWNIFFGVIGPLQLPTFKHYQKVPPSRNHPFYDKKNWNIYYTILRLFWCLLVLSYNTGKRDAFRMSLRDGADEKGLKEELRPQPRG